MTEKARELFAEGVKAYKQSRWADAHASFLAAWALSKHYSIAGNLADCELKLGLHRDAAEHFARYVREMGKDSTSTPQEQKDGEARYAQARAKVGQADVQVSVPGAEVYVDGKLIGKAPLEDPVFLDPGSHVIEARSEEYPAARVSIEAKAGVAQPVTLTLAKTKDVVVAPPPPSGSVTPPPPSPRPVWPIAVGAGATAVFLIGGISFTVLANGKGKDALTLDKTLVHQDHQRCVGAGPIDMRCSELDTITRDWDTFQNVAVGTFVGAGVFAVGTVAYLLWPAPKAKKAKMDLHVAPVLGAGHGGMIIGGAF
jgi:hypothetical protein